MTYTFAFVMDPLERINIRTDTSFAFMLAATARGHRVVHVAPGHIDLVGDMPHLKGQQVKVHPRLGDHYQVIAPCRLAASACDAIFIRTDPPFDAAYLIVTWLLSLAEGHGVPVFNSPRGIRSANEKLYALNFAAHCPTTLISANAKAIRAFAEALSGQAIGKPLDGHGGYGVVRLRLEDSNFNALVDLLTGEGQRPIVVQQFLPEAAQGDKRLFLLEGELHGAVQRVPCGGDHRGNVHVGGRVQACPITADDVALCAAVGPRLRADGLFFVGLDVIGNKLIEVNVTSPTLVQQLRDLGGPDLAEEVIVAAERVVQRA